MPFITLEQRIALHEQAELELDQEMKDPDLESMRKYCMNRKQNVRRLRLRFDNWREQNAQRNHSQPRTAEQAEGHPASEPVKGAPARSPRAVIERGPSSKPAPVVATENVQLDGQFGGCYCD
jgi:hypothetical protein